MLSKFLRVVPTSTRLGLLVNKPRVLINSKLVRNSGDFIPPDQYDQPFPNKFKLGYAMRVYWEIIPLVVTTCISLAILFGAIVLACRNKVDVVFTSNSRRNISRTMDLNNPTYHKNMIINQRYEPWPEMQNVLDKMKEAEKKLMSRMQAGCSA